jgi:hypothetical protein
MQNLDLKKKKKNDTSVNWGTVKGIGVSRRKEGEGG